MKSSGPFVVSYGVEDYFLDADMLRAAQWKNRHVVFVSGDEVDDRELVGIFESGTLDGEPKVVIVNDAHKVKGDKSLKAYVSGKKPEDDHVVVVAIIRAEKCPDVWAQAGKKGRLIEHRALKTYESNNEVIKWVEREARSAKLQLASGVSDLLFYAIGPNLYRLANEIQKLTLLVKPDEKVTVDHVRLIVPVTKSAEPYTVAEHAFAKDTKKALNTLSTVYRVMGDEAHVPVVTSLIRQTEKLVLGRSLLDGGSDEEAIASAVGMHPYRVRTHFLPLLQKHRFTDLLGYMRALRKLDVDVKSSARSKRTLVELVVLKIAGNGEHNA